jgi:hypothetical protein
MSFLNSGRRPRMLFKVRKHKPVVRLAPLLYRRAALSAMPSHVLDSARSCTLRVAHEVHRTSRNVRFNGHALLDTLVTFPIVGHRSFAIEVEVEVRTLVVGGQEDR